MEEKEEEIQGKWWERKIKYHESQAYITALDPGTTH